MAEADANFRNAYELGRTAGVTLHEAPAGGQVAFVPPGTVKIELPAIEPPLLRIRQHMQAHDLTSFVAYVNKFQSGSTQIFAEPGFIGGGTGCIKAVFDYHAPGSPDRLAHIATYAPRYSAQWETWKSACGGTIKQAELAEFIEENRGDIHDPSAAVLLDIVRTFKASKKTDFDSLTYTSDGSVLLHYSDKVEQQGKSGPMPEVLKVGIPVFFRDTAYAVGVFVRFRVGNGAVTFQLKIDRSDVVEDEAFKQILSNVAEQTGIVPYLGKV